MKWKNETLLFLSKPALEVFIDLPDLSVPNCLSLAGIYLKGTVKSCYIQRTLSICNLNESAGLNLWNKVCFVLCTRYHCQ